MLRRQIARWSECANTRHDGGDRKCYKAIACASPPSWYASPVLPHEHLIARVRALCYKDDRLDAALMYGSFAQGAGDAYSDVEFWLFFAPTRRCEVEPQAWCQQVAPVSYLLVNEFGTHVAFFPGLVRGEFHFTDSDSISSLRSWACRSAPVDRMVVIDRQQQLRPVLEALPERPAPPTGDQTEALCGRFANWLVLTHHLSQRGEIFRAVDALSHVHRHLLWMLRLVEHATEHWLTPSRCAEAELSDRNIVALRGAIATADPSSVRSAVRCAWACGRTYWCQLLREIDKPQPNELFAAIDRAMDYPSPHRRD